MVSVAGGQKTPCCSGPKLAAFAVGTLMLLTGIGAAAWAIGERGPCIPLPAPVAPPEARPHLYLFCSDRAPQDGPGAALPR